MFIDSAKKFSAFMKLIMFFTVFTKTCHWILSWTSSINFTSYCLKIHFDIILLFTTRYLQMVSSVYVFKPNVRTYLRFPWRVRYPASHLFHLITEYKIWNHSLCNFLHCLPTSLLHPNFLISSSFTDTLNLRSCLGMWVKSWHPYIRQAKFYFFYILLCLYSEQNVNC